MPPSVFSLNIERGEVTARVHAKLMRAAMRHVAEYHVANHLVRHFEDNPSTRPGGAYGYKRRGRKYLERKQRIVGHQIPNVLTGAMRATVLGSAASRITATQDRLRISMSNYFPLRQERWGELKAVTPGEYRTLRQQAHKFYRDEAAKPENRPKRKVTITA